MELIVDSEIQTKSEMRRTIVKVKRNRARERERLAMDRNQSPDEGRVMVWAEVINVTLDDIAWGIAAGVLSAEDWSMRPMARTLSSEHNRRAVEAGAAVEFLRGEVAEMLCDALGVEIDALGREVRKRTERKAVEIAADVKRMATRQRLREAKLAMLEATLAAIPEEERTGRRLGDDLRGYRHEGDGNRLTVIRRGKLVGTHRLWLCRCDCGKEKFLFAHAIKQGRVKSCGCLQAEMRDRKFTRVRGPGKVKGMEGRAAALTDGIMAEYPSAEVEHRDQSDTYAFRVTDAGDDHEDVVDFIQRKSEQIYETGNFWV